MARTTSISLTPELEAVIDRAKQTGLYSGTSEVIREALRLFEEKQARAAAFRKMLAECPEEDEELSESELEAIREYEEEKARGVKPTPLTEADLI